MQRIITTLCLAALIACGSPQPPSARSVLVLVVQPQPAQMSTAHAYPGEVRAREEATLSFRVGGKLLQREVDAGQQVHRGQRLAQLDTADLTLQVHSAQAQYATAKANLARARDEFDRYTALAEQQLTSRSLLEGQATTLKAAQSQLDAARATLDLARNQVRYAELTAPTDGVIATRLVEAGQVIAAGQPVYILASDGAREVAIALPERDITRFSIGQAVEIELWNQPHKRWPGHIRELAAAADPQTRTWAARVSLPPDALDVVELGQSARVLAEPGTKVAMQVPITALQPGTTPSETRVWIVDPATSTIQPRAITPGIYGSQSVSVLDGLQGDEWVVAAGGHLLHESQSVIAVDRHHRPVLEP